MARNAIVSQHEPIVIGDFVRLKVGSPIGLVEATDDREALVAWLTEHRHYSVILLSCLKTEELG